MRVEQARAALAREHYVGFEFEQDDPHLAGWLGAGYNCGWIFNRRALDWPTDSKQFYEGLLDLYTRSLGEPTGPWAQRVWNTVIILSKSEHWILLRQPSLITLGSLTLDLTGQD